MGECFGRDRGVGRFEGGATLATGQIVPPFYAGHFVGGWLLGLLGHVRLAVSRLRSERQTVTCEVLKDLAITARVSPSARLRTASWSWYGVNFGWRPILTPW
jgi:hypothetical protein